MEKTCDKCKNFDCNDMLYPCSDCKNTAHPGTDEHNKRPFLWEPGNGAIGEAVNHPHHYTHGKYECIDVMVDTFGKEAVQHFCVLNAFKYVWRSEHKNGLEDIKKAWWYLDKYLQLEGKKDGE